MKTIYSCPIFKIVEVDHKGKNFVRLCSNDWVNVLGFNSKNELLMIRQFRHGTGTICLETPGGFVDNNEISDPLKSAKRELQEETGFTSSEWTYLGSVDTNPAYQNNQCHYFVAKNVQKTHDLKLDENEEIFETSFHSIPQVIKQIHDQQITHSVVITGLGLLQNSPLMPQ
jgi:8-oxo-dGTP pyrophosphatase MutT (NUDIX family)